MQQRVGIPAFCLSIVLLFSISHFRSIGKFFNSFYIAERMRFSYMKFKVPAIFKNFYFATGFVFLIWMLFFDANDLISQYKITSKLNELIDEKEYYTKKREQVKKDRQELLGDKAMLEKFARERYLMKRKYEDLFIIVEKDK